MQSCAGRGPEARKIPDTNVPSRSQPSSVPTTIPREHKDETLGGGRREGEGAAGTAKAGRARCPNPRSTPRRLVSASLLSQMAPPNAFTNELEKWLFQKYIGSIVIVEFRKKSYTELKKLWDRVEPIGGRGADRKNAVEAREASLQYIALCSTGSVVKIEEGHILILTCAHVLETSFNQSNPITPEGVEDYFEVFIVCDHREGRHVSGLEARQYIQASVRRISCGMDLMLLAIPRNTFQAYCSENHAAIPMARAYPEALEKVVMLSWPPLKHRTAVSGETSHHSRLNRCVSIANPQGFTFRLAEVNILSERGSSGAPLINGAGELLCILHGGYGTFSYFVSFEDVRSTLELWGVLEADQCV